MIYKNKHRPKRKSNMKILKLTVKKKWFDMILAGTKTEEYREIKSHWINRLTNIKSSEPGSDFFGKCDYQETGKKLLFKDFDFVEFTNGYGNERPSITVKCEDILIQNGKEEWGAVPGVKYFLIKLGEILNEKE